MTLPRAGGQLPGGQVDGPEGVGAQVHAVKGRMPV